MTLTEQTIDRLTVDMYKEGLAKPGIPEDMYAKCPGRHTSICMMKWMPTAAIPEKLVCTNRYSHTSVRHHA